MMQEMINYQELEQQANPGQFSIYDMEVLVPEVQKLESGECYLEIGVDRGRSLSIARKVAKDDVRICGIDLGEDPKVPGTIFTQGDSHQLSDLVSEEITVLFVDGDHSYQGCKKDIEIWFPKMKRNGTMLFHDCDETSPGVMWAVSEFVDTHRKQVSEFKLCKRTDKNTSMGVVRLC
jgi:23S rRNA U2552 (ribose-2'-O)-methylase RlmE/FtsJ